MFHNWRQTAGYALLMLACLLSVGWVRSLRIGDYIYAAENERLYKIRSFAGVIEFRRIDHQVVSTPIRWRSLSLAQIRRDQADDNIDSIRFGFKHLVISINYSSIVIPLGLLAAFLLLSTPRNPHEP